MAKASAMLSTLSVVAATARSEFLSDLYSGKVSKGEVELVLAHHNEDLAWSEPLRSVRTVYCKGQCSADSVKLPNVGREGHTFLHHIVDNYDSLSNWTVFSQAQKPTEGYIDHKIGGGHLLTGITLDDYLSHHNQTEGSADSLFMMSSKVHLPSMRHSLRSTYKTHPHQTTPSISSRDSCPKVDGDDFWGPYHDAPLLRKTLATKCNVEDYALGDAVQSFWPDFLEHELPANEVVHYAQGARFAVSRERVHQRTKAYYQRLLDSVSSEQDPCLNYLFEFAWYYILGNPTVQACESFVEDTTVADSEVRFLQAGISGGISGDISGGISGDISAGISGGISGDEISDSNDGSDVSAFTDGVTRSTLLGTSAVSSVLVALSLSTA
mmetsp:Transcript_94655/g.197743  ORF Transcript_94655/g.197743 Transcript_94655/m.197743 type:complete len:382 (+) Transcript_94655:236-1381(+)